MSPVIATRAFWRKTVVNIETGCWDWIGARNSKGYPCWSRNSRAVLAHRVAYESLVGAIPAGMTIDHLCGRAVCVNPEHMEVVTRATNSRRGRPQVPLRTDASRPRYRRPDVVPETRRPGFCRNGHDIRAAGAVSVTKRGDRTCLACRREQQARYAARRRTPQQLDLDLFEPQVA